VTVSTLHAVHHRSRILIAGGGVAAVEALLALREHLGGTVEIELLAPDPEFILRPLAVGEPFGIGEARHLSLPSVAAQHQAHFREGALESVDPVTGTVLTAAGEQLTYDYLLVAVGAEQRAAFPGAISFGGPRDRHALEAMLDAAVAGEVRRLAFAATAGTGWLLPLYELALFTSTWLAERSSDCSLTLLTHESRPLEMFGGPASDAVAELLHRAGIRVLTERVVRSFDGRSITCERGHPRAADAMVTLPTLEGRRIVGLPDDGRGFLPTDPHGAVIGVPRVYAAGDGTTFPIKQGGIAAQQADAAAAAIALELGALDTAEPFHPVLRGMLLTGAEPRFLRARARAGVAEGYGASEEPDSVVSFQPLWWPPAKVAGPRLASYLDNPLAAPNARPTFTDLEMLETEQDEAAAEEEHEGVALLLELADASAARGEYDFALKCLKAAEDLGGPLAEDRQRERRQWELSSIGTGHPGY
jgi:sulfide:quinone oxidoreductase